MCWLLQLQLVLVSCRVPSASPAVAFSHLLLLLLLLLPGEWPLPPRYQHCPQLLLFLQLQQLPPPQLRRPLGTARLLLLTQQPCHAFAFLAVQRVKPGPAPPPGLQLLVVLLLVVRLCGELYCAAWAAATA